MTARVETAGSGQAGFQGQIPSVEPLLVEVMSTLALAAHAYLTDTDGRQPDYSSAEVAIDVATAAFERIKERLRPDERLAMAQMLTETRMTFVRKRGM
jgi:cation transport regulator ChaB